MINLPIAITLSRIGLAFVIAACLFVGGPETAAAAAALFVLAALTDYWDGELARRTGQVTRLGAMLDPIADKALTLTCFTSLWFLALIPGWTVLVMALRDIAVTLLRLTPGSEDRATVRRSGKNKTILQLAYILAALVHICGRDALPAVWPHEAVEQALLWGMYAVVVMTLWSGLRVYLSASRVPGARS
ncbi:MAG: CDP-diacylglycerol--glycerol-3-phosphate 3-phosphatidyltransferase [Candidatus Omnitrophica bacterium]|nr:CDP-diacylglycerol--glycerol-3-phosphate 3-phosphatidyltransferase [Candidatus Omnitrophota bacterium]